MIESNDHVYGYKAKLAEAAGCQRSYISQVLADKVHLTADHALGLAVFWKFTAAEKDHFLNLVLFARAGTKELRNHIHEKIEAARRAQEDIAKRVQAKVILPDETAAVFYSQWQYLAMTILTTIKAFRDADSISARLNLKPVLVSKILGELEAMGMVSKSSDGWQPTNKSFHLPRESRFNTRNHDNWRKLAVDNALEGDLTSVHYTSVCSVSREDAENIKQKMFTLIEECRKTIAASPEEDLYCLTCDWFRV